jgi:hypothetical protein
VPEGYDGVSKAFNVTECKDAFTRIVITCLGRNFAGGRYFPDHAYFLETRGYDGRDWGPPDIPGV